MLSINDLNNESILKALFKNSYNAVVIADANLELLRPKLLYVNDAFLKNTGYTLEELEGKTPRILQGEKSDRKVLNELKERLKKGKHFSGKTTNYKKDGTPFFVEWNISPIKDKNNTIIQYIAVQKDITLETNYNIFLQNIIDKLHDIVILSDGYKLVYANKQFFSFFGIKDLNEYLDQSDCICDKFLELEGFYYKKTPDEDWIRELLLLPKEKRVVSILDNHLEPNAFSVEIDLFDENKSIISFSNITNIIGEKEEYKNKAYHDSLTQAYNREFFHQEIVPKLSKLENINLGVILLDIDHFKSINDTYGHDVGDLVLKHLVNTISFRLRKEDYLIRWGGEEFLIISHIENKKALLHIAEKIRTIVENEKFEKVSNVTISLGASLLLDNESFESCIKRADQALYFSKENGRNKVTYN